MKHQQVVVDYFQMFKTSLSCIILVFFVWIFVKLIQSIFLLPRYLEQNHVLITKSLAQHSITDEELKAFEEEEQQEKQEKREQEKEKQNAEEKPETTAEIKKTN